MIKANKVIRMFAACKSNNRSDNYYYVINLKFYRRGFQLNTGKYFFLDEVNDNS